MAKIQIIDDQRLIIKATELVLMSEGYSVVSAQNGEEGIKVAEIENPNLILLDIMMPGINGWETLRLLKENSKTKHIPVVMFTAKEHPRGKQLCRELGAEDYMSKPFEPDDLLNKIEDIIEEHEEKED